MCDKTFTDKKGIISNPNYPNYDQNPSCQALINAGVGNITKFYIIDMSLDK